MAALAAWMAFGARTAAADGPKNCLVVHAAPGCEDPGCSARVCDFRPNCCVVQWDQDCVTVAEEVCEGCGVTSDSCYIDHAKASCRDQQIGRAHV